LVGAPRNSGRPSGSRVLENSRSLCGRLGLQKPWLPRSIYEIASRTNLIVGWNPLSFSYSETFGAAIGARSTFSLDSLDPIGLSTGSGDSPRIFERCLRDGWQSAISFTTPVKGIARSTPMKPHSHPSKRIPAVAATGPIFIREATRRGVRKLDSTISREITTRAMAKEAQEGDKVQKTAHGTDEESSLHLQGKQ